jgi:hypothetical protein
MRFLILSLFAFASVASAQDCPNGNCPNAPRLVTTYYQYTPRATVAVYAPPPPVFPLPTFSVPVYSAPVYYAPAPTYYYAVQPRRYRVVYVR